MPLVNSEKNAQIGKVFAEVDTTSEIYQLLESNFNASDRKLPQFWILDFSFNPKSKIQNPKLNDSALFTKWDDRQIRSCNLLHRVR